MNNENQNGIFKIWFKDIFIILIQKDKMDPLLKTNQVLEKKRFSINITKKKNQKNH